MALGCSLSKNILKVDNCAYVLQSVVDIFLINKDDLTAIAYNTDKTEVSAFTLADSAKVYHIQPAKNSASFSDTLNVNDNGSKYRTHLLSFSLVGEYNAAMVENVHALSLGSFVGVAKLASGTYVMLGNDAVGLEATVVTNVGAASSSESSGVSVELSGDLTADALPLAAEAISAFLGQVAE